MVDILIADDNIYYAAQLMNYINKNNKNVRVCGIAEDGKTTLDMLNSRKFDIILLDYKMPIYNGFEILEKVERKRLYTKSVIIITGENLLHRKIWENEMVYGIINKTSTIQEIISRIEELIINKTKKEQEKRIKNKITNELLYLGYNISHKGTSYLVQVIRYIKLNPKYEVDNLSKNVYPIIAKYYNEKVHNIKCYIQRETAEMYANCDIDKLNIQKITNLMLKK